MTEPQLPKIDASLLPLNTLLDQFKAEQKNLSENLPLLQLIERLNEKSVLTPSRRLHSSWINCRPT